MTAPAPLSKERFRGALLGLAVGDALGAAVEFKKPGAFEPVTGMRGGGPFGLEPGQWTDDTSMALCLAESLVRQGRFDPVDQMQRYVDWYRHGHLSSTGGCFDIGNATRAALTRFEKDGAPYQGTAAPNAAGNGPLMKLAPVPMAFAAEPAETVKHAAESALTTHGDPRALDGARYLAALIAGALNGAENNELVNNAPYGSSAGLWNEEPLHPEIAAVANGSYNTKKPPEIRGTGFVVEALEAALWAFAHIRPFEDGVLAAVNLGDDADTTGAIYGQLAGAFYGVGAIPELWLEQLTMRAEITTFADELHAMAHGQTTASRPPDRRPLVEPAAAAETLPGDSYWVFEDALLAGEYPGAPTLPEARRKLGTYLDLGVPFFLDLTEEGKDRRSIPTSRC